METWSDDLPVREEFRVKFFLDTNILAYLVDNSYPLLSQFIDYLKDSEFADLVSSKYVIFEFVGIRKREHYLQKVLQASTSPKGKINLSSLLKYKDGFLASEVKFEDVQAEIKTAVETELQEITNNFNIDYSANILHDTLLKPTFDINLSSKISKEDSLVLTSAIWSDMTTREEFVVITSNDKQFVDSYNSDSTILNSVFANYNLAPPIVEHLTNIKLQDGGTKVNLIESNNIAHWETFLPTKLIDLLIVKNHSLYLGKTIHCGNGVGFPSDVVCFRLLKDTDLNDNLYLTIIGKDLDFIYSTKLPVKGFYNQVPIQNYPLRKDVTTDISFRPMESIGGTPNPLPAEVVTRLRETGNLVFINPDI